MHHSIFHDSTTFLPPAIKNAAIDHLPSFIETNDFKLCHAHAVAISKAFNPEGSFERLFKENSDEVNLYQKKLIHSFERNVCRLVEKTWVEKSGEGLKEDTLYHLENFCRSMELPPVETDYAALLPDCISVLKSVVLLLFGEQVNIDPKQFLGYAVRIDPDFGLFWYYLECIGVYASFSQEKARIAIFLGMYFLALF